MIVARSIEEVRRAVVGARGEGRRVGFAPTMGALHDGHLALVEASKRSCGFSVVSIFVNPTQFASPSGAAAYPRDEERDAALLEGAGTDLVWLPDAAQVYPPEFATWVTVDERLTGVLCGAPERRGPDHFRGVTTIVAKLFNVVEPDAAFFGRKDAQQALIVQRMARDLDFPIEIELVPTVREADGLALSSRNAGLSGDERKRAAAIYAGLSKAEELAAEGATDATTLVEAVGAELRRAGLEPEYVEVRHADDLTAASTTGERPILLAVAVMVGDTRLIDNVLIGGDDR